MAKNGSFTDLLNTPADSIEAPKPVPVGTWRLTAKSIKVYEPRDEDTPGSVLFGLVPSEPQEDVDADEVAAMGEELENAILWHRIKLQDKKGAFRLRKFLETVGAELSGRSLLEAAKSVEGYEVLAYVDQDPDKDDPETIWNRLSDFAPVG